MNDDHNKNNLDEKLIQGHEYDGIQELDNSLPSWWLWLFLLSIIFAFLYFIHYEISEAVPSSSEVLKAQMETIEQKRLKKAQAPPTEKTPSLEEIIADSNQLAKGQKVFAQYCASCHGQQGQGSIGPNLTDKFWIYSKGDFQGILKAINEGFPDKGMPPWKTVIQNQQKPLLTAFVLSLKGTNPPQAKAPQGEKVEE